MKKQRKDKKNKLISAGFLMLGFAFLMGCAGAGKMSAFQMDEMLARSGFQLHTADTPKKLAFFNSLPKNKFLHKMYKEQMFYFYANDASCQCMYVGDQQAYLRFKQSVKLHKMNERIDTTSREAPQELETMPLDANNPFNVEGHLP